MHQIGALLQLRSVLDEMASNQGRGRDDATPDDKRIADAYNAAATTMVVETRLRSGRWDVDPDFRVELLNKFFTPAFRATYAKGNKDFADRVQARRDADQRTFEQLNAAAAAAQKADPGTEAARRCIASGRNPLDCIGGAMSTGLGELFGLVDPSLKPVPLAPGLRMEGVYPGPGPSRFSVTFRADAVEVACGPLIPAAHPYTAERQRLRHLSSGVHRADLWDGNGGNRHSRASRSRHHSACLHAGGRRLTRRIWIDDRHGTRRRRRS